MLKDRISKETFFRYLKLLKETNEYVNRIYEASRKSLDMINFVDDVTQPYHIIEKLFFRPHELNTIQWFVYEYDKDMMKIYSVETDEVVADIVDEESLWNYLNSEDFVEGEPLIHIEEMKPKSMEEIEKTLSGFLRVD